MEQENSVAIQNDDLYNKKIKTVPNPGIEIGIDKEDTLVQEVAYASSNSQLDIAKLESFTNISQNRDQLYALLDTMSQDSIVASALQLYASDSTERNSEGQIVWVESADPNIAKYVTFLLDSININKHIYRWAYALCKYGDIYIKLFRESDVYDELFDKIKQSKKEKNKLNESTLDEQIFVKAYKDSDKYIHYVEMVANPAEMYELTKFGKTYGFIQAPVVTPANNQKTDTYYVNPVYQYKYKKNDINIYQPTEFVHASLEDDPSRIPEEVSIFLTDADYDSNETKYNYSVKRGQSLLYSVYKIWRQLKLLENSMLLNRLTQSSIVRIIGVEVGDMPKENIRTHLYGIKQMIEQKTALDVGNSMSEYNNPGPMINNIYIPTHGQIGAITPQTIGGDVNVGDLGDVDYFKNLFYGSLGIPKQFLGDTDDAAGFSGGESLAQLSSRYAKKVKKVQQSLISAITDIVNLMCLDKGLDNYINKFTIHMQEPTTQEEVSRRENISSEIANIRDIMDVTADVEDPIIRLKMLKALLSTVVTNSEVLELIQEQIDNLELENADELEESETELGNEDNMPLFGGEDEMPSGPSPMGLNSMASGEGETEEPSEGGPEAEEAPENSESELPNPSDLGLDFTDNNNF